MDAVNRNLSCVHDHTHTRVWCSSPQRTVDVCMFAFPTLGDDGHTLASECCQSSHPALQHVESSYGLTTR